MSGGRPRLAGSMLGILVFLAGIGLVLWAFWLASKIFTQPPEIALNVKAGESLDFGQVAQAMFQLIAKSVMLVVMAGFGSAVANRGIRLYASSAPSALRDDPPA
ncbi:MAG: hypothetical protein AB7F50_04635 [Fimbriimonadaceae bacterium]